MDRIDHQILQILQNKARIPNVEVARKVKMAPSAVLERIKKLEAKGIISGYEVRLNPERFSRSLVAFLTITPAPGTDPASLGQRLSRIQGVQEVHYTAGLDGLMVKLRTQDTAALDRLLQSRIIPMEGVARTRSFIVLSTFFETAKIPLPEHT